MMEFFSANIGTIFVAIVLIAIAAMITVKLKKDKKAGKSSCGCSCGGCPNSALCHGRPIPETEKI